MNKTIYTLLIFLLMLVSCQRNGKGFFKSSVQVKDTTLFAQFGFGSCQLQAAQLPLLQKADSMQLDFFVYLGDNIYSDTYKLSVLDSNYHTGAPVAPHYCAAKAALLGLTKAWAKELAPWKILVNAVAPGGVKSGGPIKLDNPEILRAKEEKNPLKRYAEPIEMSYAVAYLVSPEADFVTGQVISPNGGDTIVGY